MRALFDFVNLARRHVRDGRALEGASEFLQFKLWAVGRAREEVSRTLEEEIKTRRWRPGAAPGEILVTKTNVVPWYQLNLSVDLFLVELVGAGEALAQLANAALDLGFAAAKVRTDGVRRRLAQRKPRPPSSTGLEEWSEQTGAAWWLAALGLRHQVSHRRLVEFAETAGRPPQGSRKARMVRFVVADGRGSAVPVAEFVTSRERLLREALQNSLQKLATFLPAGSEEAYPQLDEGGEQ